MKDQDKKVIQSLNDISETLADLQEQTFFKGHEFWSFLLGKNFAGKCIDIVTYSIGKCLYNSKYSLESVIWQIDAADEISIVYNIAEKSALDCLKSHDIKLYKNKNNHAKIYLIKTSSEVECYVGSMNFAFPTNYEIVVKVLDVATVTKIEEYVKMLKRQKI